MVQLWKQKRGAAARGGRGDVIEEDTKEKIETVKRSKCFKHRRGGRSQPKIAPSDPIRAIAWNCRGIEGPSKIL